MNGLDVDYGSDWEHACCIPIIKVYGIFVTFFVTLQFSQILNLQRFNASTTNIWIRESVLKMWAIFGPVIASLVFGVPSIILYVMELIILLARPSDFDTPFYRLCIARSIPVFVHGSSQTKNKKSIFSKRKYIRLIYAWFNQYLIKIFQSF